MTILVVTDMQFANLANGVDLRVWNLCRELAKLDTLACVPVVCNEYHRGERTLDPRELFCETADPLLLERNGASFRRHLRLNEIHYFPWSFPDYCRQATEVIAVMQKRHRARRIIAFGQPLAGILAPFRGSSRILMDICDSASLQLKRYAEASDVIGWKERLRIAVSRSRWCRSEGTLPRWFAHVITAGQADAEAVRAASGGRANVTALPNGVDEALTAPLAAPRRRRGVVFWGDLGYSVNDLAMRYFHERVYLPYLAREGVEWCLLGRNAPPWLTEAAARDPGIRLTGFVPDLRAAVAEYPVVVNPMVSGSGVKNKVLEALAMGKPVVSTPLGMESIAGAVDGEHYVAATEPQAMAAEVLDLVARPERCETLGRNARRLILDRHSWRHVGEKFRALVAEL